MINFDYMLEALLEGDDIVDDLLINDFACNVLNGNYNMDDPLIIHNLKTLITICNILYNNSDISMSLAQFVKNNVINNNVTLIQKKIDALIGKYYIGENVNIVLYAKSSLIEDATMSINKAMNVFPIACFLTKRDISESGWAIHKIG